MKMIENISLKIENIVTSGLVADAVDLQFISGTIKGCRFTTGKFPGAVYHLQNPKSAALIFSSGKMVITGLRRPEDTAAALQNVLNSKKQE